MRRHRRWVVLLGTVLMLGFARTAQARQVDETVLHPIPGALAKLGRGIANVATCPLELIRTPMVVSARDGLARGLSLGVLEGAWRTVLRGVVGVYEVATFPIEIPEGFGPILRPEFVFAEGSWVR